MNKKYRCTQFYHLLMISISLVIATVVAITIATVAIRDNNESVIKAMSVQQIGTCTTCEQSLDTVVLVTLIDVRKDTDTLVLAQDSADASNVLLYQSIDASRYVVGSKYLAVLDTIDTEQSMDSNVLSLWQCTE